MNKMKKKLAMLLAAVMMLSVVLTGCQSKPVPADKTVSAMFDLVVKEDAGTMKNLLGFASEDDVKGALLSKDYVGIADTVSQQIAGSGADFTEEQTKDMTAALKGIMNKLTCTAEIQSESKDETTVLLKVTGYSSKDLAQIETDILTDMQSNMDPETAKALQSGDQEAVKKLLDDVLDQYIKKIGEMQPSSETTDVTVKCAKVKVKVSGKDKVEWMPADIDKFVSELDHATFN